MLQEQIGITNPFYPAGSFAQANVAAEQTGVALLTPGGVGHRTALLPAMLAAVEVNLSAAASAGSATIKITKNGTAIDASAVTITTETAKVVHLRENDRIAFAAGDKIGAKITTNAAWNGTTSEIEVIPHMVYQGWEF